MRKLAHVTANIIPIPHAKHPFARRPLAAYAGRVTCLMLFRHQENEREIFVSDDRDATGAVWIPKALVTIERTDRGPYLVVTLSQTLADRHRLSTPIIDFERYAPHERALLKDAIASAQRTRRRLNGFVDPLPFPGRNAFA